MPRKVIVVTAFACSALIACSGSDAPRGGWAGGSAAGDAALVDPIFAEEGLSSCAERFSVQTLSERRFAFDGTVTEIREPAATDAPYEIVFEVARWYRGGDGPTTLVRTYDVSGTSFSGDLALAVGDRVLGSGDEDFLWGCGFSAIYTEERAGLFEDAFAA